MKNRSGDSPAREQSSDRWRRAQGLFREALDRRPEDRSAYLEKACPDDPDLHAEVEALVATHETLERSEEGSRAPGDEGPAGGTPLASGFPRGLDAARAASLLEAMHTTSPELPSAIGPYRPLRRLGGGGMGVVWLARDPRLDRKVALKLLPPWLALDEAASRRFWEEAKAASALDHANIETVHEIGETEDGRRYIVMAYYEGETLAERIRRGPLPVAEVVDVAAQVAEGLAAAHARGIVHRDIKPGNLILTPEGVAKIVDFGVAKVAGRALTKTGATLGTVAYMSPEQTRGEEVDRRTDLWSLGVVLFEMLTGKRPFRGANDRVLIHAIRNDEPEPVEGVRPAVPEALGGVVRRCLAKESGGRYSDARDLLEDLRPFRSFAASSGMADGAGVGDAGRRARAGRGRRMATAAAVGGVLLLAAGLVLSRGSSGTRPEIAAAASAIAVLPAVPVTEDSALARLGRELAVTLGANLDGIGRIRTTPALTVLAHADEAARSPEHAARVARRLGARSVLHGSLLRSGSDVRLDLVLIDAEELVPLARATATAPAEDIVALTDSAALALLRDVWPEGPMPAPSLSEITTRSLRALQAYLEGEAAFARGEYPEAVQAYERAFAEDSTFWFAYWRSLYPRIYEGRGPDSAALAVAFDHRHELPEPERLLVESYSVGTTRERLAILKRLTQRFPDYWPGWWEYGDVLVHRGPYLGTTYGDARAALDRVVELNPGFASGWEHLFWVAVFERDTANARRALPRLERLATPGSFRFNSDMLPYLHALERLLRAGGEFTEQGVLRLAREVVAIHDGGAPIRPEALATGFVAFGFPRAQLQFADAILAAGATGELAAAQWWGRSLAWAARGAWGQALDDAARWAELSTDSWAGLRAYGLATVGAALGAVEPGAAASHRSMAVGSSAVRTPEGRAELAWLDGILAYLRDDDGALAAAAALGESGAPGRARLERSLGAFRRAAAGDRNGAARRLAALEEETAAGLVARYGGRTPSPHLSNLSAVNRLAAARWLLGSGDTVRAERLLSWHEAIGPIDPAELINRTVEPLALLERARIEEATGRDSLARVHYTAFLERYDHPPPTHGALVEGALQALRRLSIAEED